MDGAIGLGSLGIMKAHAIPEIARAPQASRENIMDGSIGLGEVRIMSAHARPETARTPQASREHNMDEHTRLDNLAVPG